MSLPFQQDIIAEHRLLHVRFRGHRRITLGDMSRGYEEFLSLPGAQAVRFSLHDMRGVADFSLQMSGTELITDMVKSDADQRRVHRRIAFVAQDPSVFSSIMFYVAMLNDSAYLSAHLLASIEDALDWLGLDRSIAALLKDDEG